MDEPKNNNLSDSLGSEDAAAGSPMGDSPDSSSSDLGAQSADSPDPKKDYTPPEVPKSNKKMLAAVLVLVIVLGGAGYYLMNKNSNTDSTSSTTTNTVTKKVIPLLRFGSQNGMVTEFYPGQDSTSSISSLAVVRSVFEGLIGHDSNGRFAPLLATSWTNPDNSTWVFKLKPGVKFHNGNVMTAQIVKDSILADTPNTQLYGISNTVKSIDVVDPSTIKITTNNPDALLLNKLVNVFVYDTTSKNTNSPDNGTGPFNVKSGTKPSYDAVDLVQFAGYHGTKPLVKEIVGKAYDDDAALVAAAKANQVDVGFTFSLSNAKAITSSNSSFKAVQVEAAGAYDLSPLTLKAGSPVQKKDVRKAIYLTLDPTAIKNAAGKDGEAIGQVAPKSVSGYDPVLVRPSQDLETAKTLIKGAGYPNGITLGIFYGPPADKTVHEIGTELAKVGITLTYHPVQSFEEYTSNIKTTKYDLGFISNYSDLAEISDIISTNLTKAGDFGTYDNPAVDTLLSQATAEFDTTKRIKLLQEASGKIMDDVGVIPIFVPANQVLLRSNYQAPFDIQDGEFGTYLSKIYAQ